MIWRRLCGRRCRNCADRGAASGRRKGREPGREAGLLFFLRSTRAAAIALGGRRPRPDSHRNVTTCAVGYILEDTEDASLAGRFDAFEVLAKLGERPSGGAG